jgi:hypothetical protein
LASDETRWITGVVLPVDAGKTSGHPVGMGGMVASSASDTAVRAKAKGKL